VGNNALCSTIVFVAVIYLAKNKTSITYWWCTIPSILSKVECYFNQRDCQISPHTYTHATFMDIQTTVCTATCTHAYSHTHTPKW